MSIIYKSQNEQYDNSPPLYMLMYNISKFYEDFTHEKTAA